MSDQKRSIQDIIPPARSKPIRPKASDRTSEKETPKQNEEKLPLKPKRARKKTKVAGLFGITLVVILIVGTAFGVVSTFFHRAEITITPYAFQVTIAETFNATTDGSLLSYTTTSFETTESREVPSTSSEFVEDRATGTITIFNEYSTQSQRLITNTRFESENGLIFRIKSPITIPGYTTSGGTKNPGSVEVTVYADEPGESYNIGLTKFTIPGLAGSAQYSAIYARSKGAMTGGFVGEKAIVEESVRSQAIQDLKTELDRTVRSGLAEKLSPGQFFSADTVTVQFVEQPDKSISGGAEVSVKAIAEVPVFSETQVAALIAKTGGVVFDAPLDITNRDELTLQISTQADDEEVMELLVSGDAQLTAHIETDVLVRELAGKSQGAVGSVLVRYPGIQDLNLSVYPFWRQVLPDDEKGFTVKFDE